MDDRSQVEEVKKTLLILGLDDWVDIALAVEVARDVKAGRSFWEEDVPEGGHSAEQAEAIRNRLIQAEREALPLAIEAIKELVRDGLAQVGDTTRDGFIAWGGSAREVEMRINDAAKNAQYPLHPGALFWLRSTPAGKRLGKEVLRATPEAWGDDTPPQ